MHYLGLSLYAEGSTDYYFLTPLLLRICEEICAMEASQPVEFSEVIGLDHPAELNSEKRENRICAAAKLHSGAWRLLFIHGDGAGDANAARSNLIQPAIDLVATEFAGQNFAIAVIPVRETEAWTIWDGEALREAFGTTLSDNEMNLPRSCHEVEALADPKDRLNNAFLATNPSNNMKRKGVSPLLNSIGEKVRLDRLRMLSSFRVFEAELRAALTACGVLR